MRKKKIIRWLLITLAVILGVLVFLSITGTVAHAAGLVDNTVSDANAYSKYPLENYQLDFYVDSSWDWLPWNWLDGIGKSIQYGLYAVTNFVWTVSFISPMRQVTWYRKLQAGLYLGHRKFYRKEYSDVSWYHFQRFFYTGILCWIPFNFDSSNGYLCSLHRTVKKRNHKSHSCGYQLSCGVPVIRFIHCLRPKLYQQNQRFFRRYKQLGVIARYKNRAARFQQQGKRQCGFDKG